MSIGGGCSTADGSGGKICACGHCAWRPTADSSRCLAAACPRPASRQVHQMYPSVWSLENRATMRVIDEIIWVTKQANIEPGPRVQTTFVNCRCRPAPRSSYTFSVISLKRIASSILPAKSDYSCHASTLTPPNLQAGRQGNQPGGPVAPYQAGSHGSVHVLD
jgi:hypothetical protein